MPNSRRPDGSPPKRPAKKKRSRRWIGYTLLILFGMALGVAGLAGTYVYRAYQDLPTFEEFDPSLTSVIYDRTGTKVYELADEQNRTLVKLDQIPEEVQWAFIATEDHRFEDHFGIDLYRLGGAIIADIKYLLGIEGSQWEGASTITMQLARNAFLTLDVSAKRKVQEMLIAIDLEKRYTKDQILEQYLNTVAFGGQAYGIEAAAQQYFSKHASELTVSEAAMLAGILKGPSMYSPFTNFEGAMERREIVLDLMVQHGYLDPARAEDLKKEKPVVRRAEVSPTSVTFNGDWYIDHVISILTNPELAAQYKLRPFTPDDLYHKGLRVYTALDLNYQKIAQETLSKILPEETKIYSAKKDEEVPEGAVVIMDHRTGHVLALVGGREHQQMLGLNRATQSRRDPGSTIKPLVAYLPAIDLLGWGPATVIDDSPPRLNDKGDNVWPENYEFRYLGLKPMRVAVEQSINAMAVRTLEAITPAKGIEYGRKLGLPLLDYKDNYDRNDEHLALTLGGLSQGVTPLELTAAYGVLGSLGAKSEPIVITRIENKFGEIIWEAKPNKKQVVNTDSAWLMVDVMKGSIKQGTASYEAKGWHNWPAAGKTGTTEEWHDAWFIGFTTEIVTGVWTGYDNEKGRKRLPHGGEGWRNWTGAGPPTKVWTQIMDQIYKEAPPDWERPKSIVKAPVCEISGMLPSPLCPPDKIKEDWFRAEYVPKKMDDILTRVTVVQQPWVNPKDKKVINRYYLWQPGCAGTPETLTLIRRPTTWVKHPKDPYNIAKYWPADWWMEVPSEKCTPVTPQQPKPPGSGTGSGSGTGTGAGDSGSGTVVKPPVLPPVNTKP
ncbi:MAG: transglycosylase domain-containing protein [Bacillota bacterium]